VSFALCVASQVFVYFVIDSVQKLLDTPSYHMPGGPRSEECSHISQLFPLQTYVPSLPLQ
jgi:hypothetical protein